MLLVDEGHGGDFDGVHAQHSVDVGGASIGHGLDDVVRHSCSDGVEETGGTKLSEESLGLLLPVSIAGVDDVLLVEGLQELDLALFADYVDESDSVLDAGWDHKSSNRRGGGGVDDDLVVILSADIHEALDSERVDHAGGSLLVVDGLGKRSD